MSAEERISIRVRDYHDYRSFLSDYVARAKQKKPGWSYGAWARHLGLKSSSSITKIISGHRNPGEAFIDKLIKYFSFDELDATYFRDLINLERLHRHKKVSELIERRLMINAGKQKGRKFLDEQTFKSLSRWYFLAILEMLNLRDFHSAPEWIAQKLNNQVSIPDVAAALNTLIRAGLIERGPSGTLSLPFGSVEPNADIKDESIKRYHEEVLVKVRECLHNTPHPYREISGSTFVVSSQELPQLKAQLRALRSKLVSEFERVGGDSVYHLEIALVPLTKVESVSASS